MVAFLFAVRCWRCQSLQQWSWEPRDEDSQQDSRKDSTVDNGPDAQKNINEAIPEWIKRFAHKFFYQDSKKIRYSTQNFEWRMGDRCVKYSDEPQTRKIYSLLDQLQKDIESTRSAFCLLVPKLQSIFFYQVQSIGLSTWKKTKKLASNRLALVVSLNVT